MADASPAEAPLSVAGIGEEDFNRWRHHPVTKLVFRYLADHRLQLIELHVGRWLAGAVTEEDHEMRGRALAAGEITELKLPAIVAFYDGADVTARVHGTEAHSD